MTSFSAEMASISFGVFVSSRLIVTDLLVAYSADPGEAEGVTFKDDRRLLHLVFGQGLSALHRHHEIPSALKLVQVRLWRRRCRRLTVARRDQQAAIISNRAFITSKAGAELLPFPVFGVCVALCIYLVFE